VYQPGSSWPRILLASTVAVLLACSSSSDGGGSGGSGSGGSGAGGSGVGGSGAGGSGAGGSSDVLDLNGFGQRYKLADNEVSGWTQDTASGSFSLFDNTNLTQKIDGPADGYTKRGMKLAYYQDLKAADGKRTCTMVAMDFGSAANAKSMVDYQRDSNEAKLTIPPYDGQVAIASQALTGITVYASFGALYLEVILDGYGYPPDLSLATKDGAQLLAAMEAKPKLLR
jgi:hypothetical protein